MHFFANIKNQNASNIKDAILFFENNIYLIDILKNLVECSSHLTLSTQFVITKLSDSDCATFVIFEMY